MKVSICGLLSKWKVALVGMTINILHTSLIRIASFQFVASMERYNASRKAASLPYVLRPVVGYLIGPVVGYLGCKFGLERIIMLGCITSPIAMGACFFAEDILTVILCYGVLLGIAMALSFQLLPPIIKKHYSKQLTQANGIAIAGGALGGFIYPPMNEFLQETYGLSGAFLLLSAIILHTVPAAMLLKTSEHPVVQPVQLQEDEEIKIMFEKCSDTKQPNELCGFETKLQINMLHDTGQPNNNFKSTPRSHGKVNEDLVLHPQHVENIKGTPKEISSNSISRMNMDSDDHNLTDNKSLFPHLISSNQYQNIDVDNAVTSDEENYSITRYISDEVSDMEHKSIASVNYCKHPQHKEYGGKTWEIFSLFHDPVFYLIAAVQSSFFALLVLFSTIIVDFMTSNGLSMAESAYIIMVQGIADLLGRICFGWVTDNNYMSATKFSALCYFCLGLSFSGLAFFPDRIGIVVCMLVGGIAIGAQFTICPVVISKYFDGEKGTIALTSATIFLFPLSCGIPYLIGYFKETLGSYEWLFHGLNLYQIGCGICLLLIPSLARYRQRGSQAI